eukprot:scaffold3299_cov198-Ochromonas_danica.AAC.3
MSSRAGKQGRKRQLCHCRNYAFQSFKSSLFRSGQIKSINLRGEEEQEKERGKSRADLVVLFIIYHISHLILSCSYNKNKMMIETRDAHSSSPSKSELGQHHPQNNNNHSHNSNNTKNVSESMDFEEMESVMWRKHQLRRFFQDRGQWWTNSRRTTAWKWILVVATGILIGIIGYLVSYLTSVFTNFKFDTCNAMINRNEWASAFFSFFFFCIFYSVLAGILCWIEPAAVGSGIPEIKAYLNGINLNKVVRIRVLFAKVLGMCFSVSSGLPLGKEGPMIHSGSIVGAAVSQGKTITFGLDTSWTKFQDLRNDRSKRDFVTFGAAAGVAAAFSAPIGGILFTLEEGASFWSTTLTFRAFFCAMMTQLTLSVISNGFQLGVHQGYGLFAFGQFDDFQVPGFVTDAGSYALVGSAAMLGGMSRMTIAGTIIILEACVSKSHNGFPVIDRRGHLKGFILRKTLCNIIKLKAFSMPIMTTTSTTGGKGGGGGGGGGGAGGGGGDGVVQLAPAATVFYDTLERNYPHYPKIDDISLSAADMNCFLDIRPYMDTAPYTINASSSVQRAYRYYYPLLLLLHHHHHLLLLLTLTYSSTRFFRTMGLRHLVVLDDDHRVAGIITRKDITEHRLEHHWFSEGDNMQKFINVDPVDPGMLPENMGLLGEQEEEEGDGSGGLVDLSGMNPLNMKGTIATTTTTTGTMVATAAPIVTVAQFEVSDRVSGVDEVGGAGGGGGSAGYVAPSIPSLLGTVTTTTPPPPPPPTTTSTTSSTSRTREQRAMKEPKSL